MVWLINANIPERWTYLFTYIHICTMDGGGSPSKVPSSAWSMRQIRLTGLTLPLAVVAYPFRCRYIFLSNGYNLCVGLISYDLICLLCEIFFLPAAPDTTACVVSVLCKPLSGYLRRVGNGGNPTKARQWSWFLPLHPTHSPTNKKITWCLKKSKVKRIREGNV